MKKTVKGHLPDLPHELKKNLSSGQKAADVVTKIVGSWAFIISVLIMLVIWITINAIKLFTHAWDPYPFILLNFVLSCLAALQAPIILMSQNRENERDRIRQKYDYLINRKAEHEVEEIQKELKQIKKYLVKMNSK